MSTSEWAEQIDSTIDRLFPRLVAIRRHLHAHPEPSGCEHETSLYLYQLLDEAGFDVRFGPEGRGVIVDPADPPPRPRVAVRADIDALRLQDAKDVGYRSQNPGVMHACGHDSHAATVVGTLLTLQAVEEAGGLPWPVCWRGIFQPAEETALGAREMIAVGALEGVDCIYGLHIDPARDVGCIGIRTGAITAACDDLTIRLSGRGGHASRPHESIDPIAAAAQLISTIYLFVPRAIDSHEPIVVTFGQIAGGDNPNVIPEHVLLRGTLRSLDNSAREQTKAHIQQLSRGLAETSGTRIDVEFKVGPPSVNNDSELTALVRDVAVELIGPDHVEDIPRPSMGGEDFAFYLDHVPGCMFRLGSRSQRTGAVPLHSPLFDVDEEAIKLGAKLLARAMVKWSAPSKG